MKKEDVVRAWRDPQFRGRLSEERREELPAHPAGDADLTLSDLENVAGSTSEQWGTHGCCNTPVAVCTNYDSTYGCCPPPPPPQ